MKTPEREDDELKKALETAKEYVSDSGDDGDLNSVAWAFLEANEDLASAEAFARRAVELDRDNNVSILHTLLASILLAQRNWAQAKPYVRSILDRFSTGESSLRQDSIDQMIADAVRVGGP